LTNSVLALEKLLTIPFTSVLDLGAGDGKHSLIFKENGKKVNELRFSDGDYLIQEYEGFDCIWASHVLEHQLNVNLFLKKCFKDLNDDGILAITVPPLKNEIVGGHLTLWNAGLLLYNLVLAGFDCSAASIKTYGYNISVIVRKVPRGTVDLSMDYGDIESIKQYLPLEVKNDTFNGDIEELNW
jgi:2-polyprenyl-3-methyl-5-hydroxy-6-metoxy-1,4-benzoquinol methylase